MTAGRGKHGYRNRKGQILTCGLRNPNHAGQCQEFQPMSTMLATRIVTGATTPTPAMIELLAKSYLAEVNKRKKFEGRIRGIAEITRGGE